MARKPTDYVQVKVRMREALRRKLERAAEKKKISTNAEAVERIEYTFAEEEEHEAQRKYMEEEREEINEQQRQYYEEQARLEERHKAALRDSKILNMMVEFKYPSALLLRVLAREAVANPEWASTPESRGAFADRLHSIITTRDFTGDFK
jgi:hypothetical protein